MSEYYVRLYEKVRRSEVGQDFTVLGLWAYLLLSASSKRQILRNGVVLEPGECLVSSTELARMAKCSKRTIQRVIQNLTRNGLISVVNMTRNGTHLSICNFKTYQPQFFEDDAKVTRNGTNRDANEHPDNIYITNNTPPKETSNNSLVSNGAAPRAQFKPPTLGEVQAYIDAKGYTFDAEAFVAHYEARGWMLGRQKMRSWQHACITWQKNQHQFARPQETKKRKLFD